MFVWRKRASAAWLAANETALFEIAGSRLAIISEPGLQNVMVELASGERQILHRIRQKFGGRIEKLSRHWLQKFLRGHKSRPLKIGKRLVIVSSGGDRTNRKKLLIPAGTAFGTGEHVTTAMSLRMLERLTRKSVARGAPGGPRGRAGSAEEGFSVLDLGTGSGILALAAARFGARQIIAIDNDQTAIRIAKENACRNKIARVDFRRADVRHWKFPARIDIITANLFSELLIQILPKLKCAEWLILSGVLREHERNVSLALNRNGSTVVETRHRGKWVTFLARHREREARHPAEASR